MNSSSEVGEKKASSSENVVLFAPENASRVRRLFIQEKIEHLGRHPIKRSLDASAFINRVETTRWKLLKKTESCPFYNCWSKPIQWWENMNILGSNVAMDEILLVDVIQSVG